MSPTPTIPPRSRTHTPGPWVADPEGIGSFAIRAAGKVGHFKAGVFTVATVGCSSPSDLETERANQRLIAAAPDLLAVLKQMHSAISMGNEPRHWNSEATRKWLAEAIAKAEVA